MTPRRLSALARRLKHLRERAGLTQQELAMQAGLSVSAVFQIEQGSKTDPRVSTAKALARALGVTVDVLLAEETREPPENEERPP